MAPLEKTAMSIPDESQDEVRENKFIGHLEVGETTYAGWRHCTAQICRYADAFEIFITWQVIRRWLSVLCTIDKLTKVDLLLLKELT